MTATLGFSRSFSAPFSSATSTSALVPGKFDVSIDGRGYMLDRKMLVSNQIPIVSSIRATRAQSDGSNEPGEQSLNPDDLWRRTQQSWHLGMGQTYLDREDSQRSRYRTSTGINPWVKNQVSLLNATAQSLAATGSNLQLVPAGSRLYATDGATLKYTTDLTSWSTVTGTSGATILSIASDGYYVWIADGSDVYRTNTGATSASSWTATDADYLGYVKGRLMYTDANVLGYVSNMGTPTLTPLFTHANTNFIWINSFAEGPGFIYAAGTAGDKSLVYKITITAEGTALGAPTVAGELPDGETIYSLGSYLGFIFLGTSKGARFCTVSQNGDLTIGSLVTTPAPVRCFEGQGEFVWYGLTNWDGTRGGLGRMSLRYFSDAGALLPAYASDLMHSSTANILSVATFGDIRVFAVSGVGYYKEDTANLVSTATLDSGWLNFGITEKKIPAFLDVNFKADFSGQVSSYFAVDGSSTYSAVGTHTTASAEPTSDSYKMSEAAADQVEIRHVLTRGTPTTTGPVLLRHTVRALPVPLLRQKFTIPILLHDRVDTNSRTSIRYDCLKELAYAQGWRDTKRVLALQVGNSSFAAAVEDFDFFPFQPTADRTFWQGTLLLSLKTV